MTNTQLQYDVKAYGDEGEHVVIIDDFTEDFTTLKQTGQSCNYTYSGGFYPGVQAGGDGHYIAPRGQLIFDIMKDVFGYSNGYGVESCAFSLVAKPADQLHPLQRIPHFDSQDPKLFALLHYIQGPETAGTAFYRHRRTGYETVDTSRAQTYQTALETDMQEYGLPEPGYIYGDTPPFERLLSIEARPNRAILYRGHTLHSGLIPKDMPLTTNPFAARMTLNTFIWAA